MAQTATEPDTDDGFELPETLGQGINAEKQQTFLQALYDNPGKPKEYYEEVAGYSDDYMSTFRYQYPGVVERTDPHGQDGRVYAYRLTDEARKALADEGVIDTDDVSELMNEAEEPSQQTERGNMTFVGSIDARTDPLQTIDERPVTDDRNDESTTDEPDEDGQDGDGPDDGGGETVTKESDEVMKDDDAGPEQFALTLEQDEVFDLIRSADEAIARSVLDQIL